MPAEAGDDAGAICREASGLTPPGRTVWVLRAPSSWFASFGQGRGPRHAPPSRRPMTKGSRRVDLAGAGIGRPGIGRTLTPEWGESSLVSGGRPPGSDWQPPAGRDIVD